ncbi:hypothetical protein [Stappia indica]|uniref:hypothetical protein n=1 Tax=Stappia indica TaxID=538381 RepID=UPI00083140E7|nr:hypothetical protein [Stappia indica]
MKIRQRRNGDWCMEHDDTEAPFTVLCHAVGKFSVFDLDDEDLERPLADLEDAETCERIAAAHMRVTP